MQLQGIVNQNAEFWYFQAKTLKISQIGLSRMGNSYPPGEGKRCMGQKKWYSPTCTQVAGGPSASETVLLCCDQRLATSVSSGSLKMSSPAKSHGFQTTSALPEAPTSLSHRSGHEATGRTREEPGSPILLKQVIQSSATRQGNTSSFPTSPQRVTNK